MDQRARIPSIHRIKQSATENCLDVGYRYVDGLDGIPRVGDACECSNDWDENTELPGTCTFDNLDDCLEYARHSTGHLLVVTGSFVKYGAMSGEAILANATIQAVLSRTATDRDWE